MCPPSTLIPPRSVCQPVIIFLTTLYPFAKSHLFYLENLLRTRFSFPHLLLIFYSRFAYSAFLEWPHNWSISLPTLPALLNFFHYVQKLVSLRHFPSTYSPDQGFSLRASETVAAHSIKHMITVLESNEMHGPRIDPHSLVMVKRGNYFLAL